MKLNENELHKNQNTDTLIFAHVIFRHGDRNIEAPYGPNDPYKDEVAHWPGGFGQLTEKGKWQIYRLGQYFQRRYGKLIGRKCSSNQIYIQSTDYDRTKMSAEICASGLCSTSSEQMWNGESSPQPILVHAVPKNVDHVLSIGKFFPKCAAARQNYLNESLEVQQIYSEYADHFNHWALQSGTNITTIDDVYTLYNVLCIESSGNKPLPDWARKAIEPNGIMEEIAKFKLASITPTSQMAKLKCGLLIKEMIERFEQKINSTLDPSLWLYSAHEFTIANVLNSLGLFEPHIPPFAASLHFELYQTEQNEHYLQIFYRKSNEKHMRPMRMPGCGDKCTLDQFNELYKDIIPSK